MTVHVLQRDTEVQAVLGEGKSFYACCRPACYCDYSVLMSYSMILRCRQSKEMVRVSMAIAGRHATMTGYVLQHDTEVQAFPGK